MTLFVFRMALKNELLKYWYILECICLTHQILSHGEFTSINFLSHLVSQTMSSMPYCSLVNLQCFIILDNPFFQNKSTIVCICVIIDIHVHSWRESNQNRNEHHYIKQHIYMHQSRIWWLLWQVWIYSDLGGIHSLHCNSH